MEAQLENALAKAIRFLDKNKIKYALIGGVALSHWGYDRLTRDVDFKIVVPDLDYPAMRALIRKEFPINGRPYLPLNSPVCAVNIDGVIVDFALGHPGYELLMIERAVPVKAKKLTIRYATAEDIIILKMITERSRDWADIEQLTNALYHKLDYAYIEDWLKQFGEAMEQDDLAERYKQVVAKAKQINDTL